MKRYLMHFTGGIPRIDDDDSANVEILFVTSLCDGTIQFHDIQRPIVIFVQIIAHLLHAIFDDGGRVERVLRDRNHDAGSPLCHPISSNRREQFQTQLNRNL